MESSTTCENIAEEKSFLIVGNIIHCLEPERVIVTSNSVIAVKDGKICAIDAAENFREVADQHHIAEINFLGDGEFLMPGLIDTHIHAPQFPNVGLGYDKPLLGWLDEYTFPLEAKYSDDQFAKLVYDSVVKRTIACGTTTACYFATIHLSGSLILADSIIESGQRALVGKVNMNMNHPSYYGEESADSLRDTESFINSVLAKENNLVKPVITPRFAISCDMELMEQLGVLAKKYDVHIQTHISENKDEVEFVKELFPDQKNYADVYDTAGLLTNKTVLAHGVLLTDEEIQVIVERKSSISHCPTSNNCLRSGICPVRKLLNNGVAVGLGTDVAGGCHPSMIEVMKGAVMASNDLSIFKAPEGESSALNYEEVFYMATLGGAKALAMDDKIGNFEVGKEFDALVVDLKAVDSMVDFLIPYNVLELVQKFIFLGDDRNVKKVYVSGKLIKSI